jgi:hypothetical protein
VLYVNGAELTARGVYLKDNYSVSAGNIDRIVYGQLGGAGFAASPFRYGLRTIKIPLRIIKPTAAEAEIERSSLIRLCSGSNTELMLPGGVQYTACLTSAGNAQKQANGIIDSEFVFLGYQHGSLVMVAGLSVFCDGTMPDTPARFSSVVTAAGVFSMCGVTFSNCEAGDTISLDGIKRRVLYNGAPCDLSRCDIVDFPALQPGINTLSCDGDLATEYFPMYL